MLLVVILLMTPYLILSFFCSPIADDFSFAYQFKYSSYIKLVHETYLHWSGRYFSNALIYLVPITLTLFSGYSFFSLISIIAIPLSFYGLLRNVFRNASQSFAGLLAIGLSLIYLNNLPSLSEQVYWYTGSVVYHWGLVSFTCWMITLVSFIRTDNKRKQNFYFIGSLILLIITAGFNEVMSLIMLVLLGVMTFIQIRRNLALKPRFILLFILMLCCFAVMVISPGNAVRQTAYPHAHEFYHATGYSFMQAGRFVIYWVTNPTFILMSILYAVNHNSLAQHSGLIRNSFYLHRWFSLSLLFFIVFLAAFPPYWATGILGQHRTMNVAWFFFLWLWFINVSIWMNHLKKNISIKKSMSYRIITATVISLLFFGNERMVLEDLIRGDAQTYHRELTERHRDLRGKTSQHVPLKALSVRPESLYIIDITEDPDHWINESYALYFEKPKGSILLKE
ncbi:MAG: hypothetical protein KDD41_01790 [Flavobacteriales bacterium]|nr:hypothetical protein [Flavobacteriales bacterium]